MAARRKRKYKNWISDDPCDGLEINNINRSRFASKKKYNVTMFDANNIAIEITASDGKKSFKSVSIMRNVRKTNGHRTISINGYKEHINGRE